MSATFPPTTADLAQIHTSSDLAGLLHHTGFAITAIVGHRDTRGIHLDSCPASNLDTSDFITGPELDGDQPAIFAPCCATLSDLALARSLGAADDYLRHIRPDNVSAAADAYICAIRNAAHTGSRSGPEVHNLIIDATTISRRSTALGSHYTWVADIITTIIDIELAADGRTQPPHTHVIYLAGDAGDAQEPLTVRTRLLCSQSQLTFPGSRIFVLDAEAAEDLTRCFTRPGSIRTLFRTDTTAAAWEAAHTAHTFCANIDPTANSTHIANVLGDIAGTVAALHPHIRATADV
jgi:hypothetical protein